MRGCATTARGERAEDAAAGRAAARVDDPPPAVAALQAERELAAAVGVEVHAELLQLADAVGGLVGEGLGRGAAREAAAGRQRVLEVQLGRVVDRQRGGRAALRPVGGGLGQRARGDERDAGALAGGGQGGEEPGRAGADDDEVGSHTVRQYGAGDGGKLTPRDLAARRRRLRPRRARASGAPGADPGAGGGDERARLVRGRARRGAGGRARRAGARASGVVRGLDPRSCARPGGGAIDADTYAVPGTYGAALRACGRRRRAGRRAAGRRGRRGRERAAAARASRRGGAGDGVLLLRQRRGRGAAGDVRARALARADRRLGRPPRQRHQRHLPRGCRRPVRLDPRVAAVSGDGAGVGRRVGRGRGLHRQPARAGRDRGTRSTARWSSTWRAR